MTTTNLHVIIKGDFNAKMAFISSSGHITAKSSGAWFKL